MKANTIYLVGIMFIISSWFIGDSFSSISLVIIGLLFGFLSLFIEQYEFSQEMLKKKIENIRFQLLVLEIEKISSELKKLNSQGKGKR